MKLLILGHGRHGKDTVAEIIAELTGMRFTSSSLFAARRAVYSALRDEEGYETLRDCYNDRHNHRQRWYELIRYYNTPDKARLCREMLTDYDMYVGMRCADEFAATRELFDHVLWVDRSERCPPDPTMHIQRDDSMIVINNNGQLHELRQRVCLLTDALGLI